MPNRNENSQTGAAVGSLPRGVRRRTSAGAATRERILGAAERLFAERGFSGVSMPAIAAAAGITAGAIYKHFESKEQLFFAIVGRAMHGAVATMDVEGRSALASVAAILTTYTARRLKRARQLAIETHYAATGDTRVRRLLREAVDQQIADLAAGVSAAQAAGEVDVSLDPQLTASMLMTLLMGLMHGETLTPRLVGDTAWSDFIASAIERLLAPR